MEISVRLNRGDKRTLMSWIAAGLAGCLVFAALYTKAFPEATVNMTANRGEAETRAVAFLSMLGHSVEGYRHAIAFRTASESRTFLEQEAGIDQTDVLAEQGYSIWTWTNRWFKPQQEEGFYVWLNPEGRVTGFVHTLPEAADGARLSSGDALDRALDFLDRFTETDLSQYRLVDSGTWERPNRRDHVFTWEHEEINLAGARLRINVMIQGDAPGLYSRYLEIPEAWKEAEADRQALRGLLFRSAYLAHNLLALAAFAVFLIALRRWQLRYRFAVVLGGILAVLVAVGWLNGLGLTWMSYDTTLSVSAFFGSQALGVGQRMLEALFATVIVGTAGDFLARMVFPRHTPVSRILERRFWLSKPIFIAAIAGFALAFMHAAYVSVFYVAGREVGVYSPLQAPYLNSLATPLPWLYPLTIGLYAAIDEEFMYRLFAISLLLRYVRISWLAVLIPAVVWGFLHSNYPQEPAYTRGIELAIVGVVFGLLYVRFGILVSIVSHYTYNALLGSMVLLRSDDLYLRASGAVVVLLMLAPVLPGLIRWLRQGEFLIPPAEDGPIDEPVPSAPAPDPPSPPPVPCQPIPWSRLGVVAVLGIVAIASSLIVEEKHFGDYIQLKTNRLEAEAKAVAFLRERGIDTSAYRVLTRFRNNLTGDGVDYVYQQDGEARLNEIAEKFLPKAAAWTSRFYIPSQREGYAVWVLPDGSVFGHEHFVGEDAPGASLTEEEARTLAERFLTEEKNLDLDGYRLVDSGSRERPARTDWGFVWEHTTAKFGDGSVRIYVPVMGDEVSFYEPYIHVPDEWRRERERRDTSDVIHTVLVLFAATMGLAVFGAIAMSLFIAGEIRWRFGAAAGLFILGLGAFKTLNEAPGWWSGYNPVTEPVVFVTGKFLEVITSVSAMAFAAFLAGAFADGLYRRAFPGQFSLGDWTGIPRFPGMRQSLQGYWGDGLIAGGLFALAAMFTLPSNPGGGIAPANWRAPGVHDSAPSVEIAGTGTVLFPAAEYLLNGIAMGVAAALLVAVAASIYTLHLKRIRNVVYLAAGGILLFASGNVDSFEDYFWNAVEAIMFAVAITAIALLVAWVCRRNVPAYALTAAMAYMVDTGVDLVKTPNPVLSGQGALLLGICAAAALTGLYLRATHRPARTGIQPITSPSP